MFESPKLVADCAETFLQCDAYQSYLVFFLPDADASGLPLKSGLAESPGSQAVVEKAPGRGPYINQASGFDVLSYYLRFLIVLSWDCSLQLPSQLPPMAWLDKNASDQTRRKEKRRNCLARKELGVSTRILLQRLGKVMLSLRIVQCRSFPCRCLLLSEAIGFLCSILCLVGRQKCLSGIRC